MKMKISQRREKKHDAKEREKNFWSTIIEYTQSKLYLKLVEGFLIWIINTE